MKTFFFSSFRKTLEIDFVPSDLKFCDYVFLFDVGMFSSIVLDPLNLKTLSFNSDFFSWVIS